MKTPRFLAYGTTGLVLLALSTGLSGCSAKQVYGGLQQGAKNDCAFAANSTEYDQCMERADMSYEEYEQAREEARANSGADDT